MYVVILYSCAPGPEFMSKGFSLPTRLRSDAPKDFITPVTRHAANAALAWSFCYRDGDTVFSRQFGYSA